MTMLEIYYHPLSFPSMSALFTAEALDLQYQKKIINLAEGEHRHDAYLAINPFGKVPAIKDNDFCLAESATIMRYMAHKADNRLYGQTPQTQAITDQWLDYIHHHIRQYVGRIQFNRTIAPMQKIQSDPNVIAEAERFLTTNLPVIERQLADTPYICNNTLSLADLALIASLEPVKMAAIDISAFPNLQSWLASQRRQPFYTQIHNYFGEELGF